MAAAGLKTEIWNNNLRSLGLLALYPFLIAILVWVLAFVFHYFMVDLRFHPICDPLDPACADRLPAAQGHAPAAAQSTAFILRWWPAIFAAVIAWFMIAYFFQAKMIRALSHAHPVTRAEEPELYNMLENLCISRGMKMPRLEIIETHARNAFASGIDDQTYAVTVTRGLLQSLQKDEVEAVLAHELTHIMNRDVRLLIISIIFAGMIGFFAQMAWSSLRFGLYGGHRRSRSDPRALILILIVVAILWLGYFATMFTRFAVSRRREFMADAGAAELTRNPEAMMRALLRIAGKDRIPEATGDIVMMCIENSAPFMGLFSTHPPIEARIQALSRLAGTPVPALHPGHRADDTSRFKDPAARQHPWLTATRQPANPWRRQDRA